MEASADRLVLIGPSTTARLASGTAAGLGGVFAGMGLSLLRAAVPGPLKLVPLAVAAVGSGLAAVGVTATVGGCSVEVTRAGLVLKWKLPARAARTVRIAAAEVDAVEVISRQHSAFGRSSVEYQLAVVLKGGHSLSFEAHDTWTQADERRQEVLRRLADVLPLSGAGKSATARMPPGG